MELLLNIEELEHQINGEGLTDEGKELINRELSDFGELDIKEANIGPGADVMVIAVTVLTIANVFLLGDKIDKGIDGWIKLGKRIKELFKKKELTAVDMQAASLLAIELVANNETIKTLEKTAEQEIALVNFAQAHLFGDDRTEEDLISKPYSYYIFSYLVNNEKHYVIGVKSSGESQIIKCFDAYAGYGISELSPKNQTN